MTDPDPMASMLAAWKQATQTYIDLMERSTASLQHSAGAVEARDEAAKTALGSRAAMDEVSRRAFEPMVALAGGVTASDFRRLADDLHTILLRLDRIDDEVRRIQEQLGTKKASKKKNA